MIFSMHTLESVDFMLKPLEDWNQIQYACPRYKQNAVKNYNIENIKQSNSYYQIKYSFSFQITKNLNLEFNLSQWKVALTWERVILSSHSRLQDFMFQSILLLMWHIYSIEWNILMEHGLLMYSSESSVTSRSFSNPCPCLRRAYESWL